MKKQVLRTKKVAPKIEVDVHLFTSGMGGAGKTTALLNTLSYYARKQKSDHTIIVFDEGDNTDFASHWLPHLMIDDPPKDLAKHDYVRLSYKGHPEVISFESLPSTAKGLNWSTFGQIINSRAALKNSGRKHRITALVDTGGAPGRVLRNAGAFASLSPHLNWRFFPWVLWTANSLTNKNFVGTTRLALDKLSLSAALLNPNVKDSVVPIFVFNPILLSGGEEVHGFMNQLRQLAMIGNGQAIVFERLLAYKQRPVSRFASSEEFFEKVNVAFANSAGFSSLDLSPVETYKEIGRYINEWFVDEKTRGPIKSFGNIFTFGVFDPKIASLKISPGQLNQSLRKFVMKSSTTSVEPVRFLYTFFEDVYRGFETNLDKFHEILD